MKKVNSTPGRETRLGFFSLSALVFSMVVGAGIFNIPQNMAAGAGLVSVVISWIITALGMLLLLFTFKILSEKHPELDAGIYQYAREGYGAFAGFLTAWGYWLCTAFANVAYSVMLNDTFGAFFPTLLHHGLPTVIFGGVFIWLMYGLIITGLRTAHLLTTILSCLKLATILLIIVLIVINCKLDFFRVALTSADCGVGPMLGQIRSTMLVTLWCFIGIEGAVVMSGRAKSDKDVSRAGVTGFLCSWILYVLVSIFCFGVMTRAQLAGLHDPSVAYVMKQICGPWAYWLVVATIIISLTGSWVSWTLICAEVPYSAAQVGIFPRGFLRLNRFRMPAFGLFISSLIMQLFLILVAVADKVYLTAINITGMMILPAYLACGLYLLKISIAGRQRGDAAIGALCTLFCMWMIYAGGLLLFMETSLFYMAGLWFHFRARHERGIYRMPATERIGLTILLIAALASVIVLAHH